MEQAETRDGLLGWLLMSSILAITAFGGGFTWQECILSCFLLLFILILSWKRMNGNVLFPVLFALAALGGATLLFTLGDKQNALYAYEKLWCFLLAVPVGMCLYKKESLLWGAALASSLTAAVGLLAVCRILRAREWVFNDRRIVRLQSLLGYANTTAVLLGCGYFAILALWQKTQKKWLLYLSSGVLIALYLTVSKAAIPLFLAVGTLLVFRHREYERVFILGNLSAAGIALSVLFLPIIHAAKLLLIIAGICASGYWLGQRRENLRRLFWLPIVGAAAILSGFAVFLRMKHIDIFKTLFGRITYMKDAAFLCLRHPLLGIGPGGWRYYQFGVQTSGYSVSSVHNGPLQILLEYGLVFFLLFFALLCYAAYRLFREKRAAEGAAFLLVLLHSLVDMDLEFGLILMLLGLWVGSAIPQKRMIGGKAVLSVLMAGALVVFSYAATEFCLRSAFERAYRNGEEAAALHRLQKLEILCPYDSNLQISLAALSGEDAAPRIDRAMALSPLDHRLTEYKIEYEITHHGENVLSLCRQYVYMAKRREETYVRAAEFAQRAREENLCTKEEYEAFLAEIHALRREMGVIDRNEMLDDVIKNRKGGS